MVGASICEVFSRYPHAKKQIVMKKYQLFNGNNIDKLRELEDNSVDAVVTDAPYGLSFMSKKWDYDVPSVELWREVYRVLKPGGHVLSFGGTRTYHRMVVNMEDAGFEIRDQIQWLYGSGFPKSHDIGLNIDKKNGKIGNRAKAFIVAVQSGQKDKDTSGDLPNPNRTIKGYKSENEWNGWGTALKPANEPICLARKPFVGTVAENVLQYGTGGLNIDECRIATDELIAAHYNTGGSTGYTTGTTTASGRFPANVIHDGSDEVVELLTNAARFFYCPKVSKSERNAGCGGLKLKTPAELATQEKTHILIDEDGNGRTSPYLGKISPAHNHHPTIKPIDLMRYLCKLITPPGGIVLDPFMGSGSTGCAAILEDFRFIGMELDEEYFKIAEARITHFNPSDFW
jgi:site-specific DNA-methyltransferase (adenine-specific)